MKKTTIIGISCGMHVGCMGTIGSLHFVTGVAPLDENCVVEIVRESSEYSRREEVSGYFEIDLTAGGYRPRPVNVLATCNGVEVKSLNGISLREVGNIDLGNLRP